MSFIIPMQDFTESWTDEKLYAKYGIIKSKLKFIESMVKPKGARGKPRVDDFAKN